MEDAEQGKGVMPTETPPTAATTTTPTTTTTTTTTTAPTTPKAKPERKMGIPGMIEMFQTRLLRKAYRPGVRGELPDEVRQCEAEFISIAQCAVEAGVVQRQEWSDTCEAFSDTWPHICHWLHPGRLADQVSTLLAVKFEGKRPQPASREARSSKPTIRAKKYYCAECDVVCNSLGQFDIHQKGRKHQDNVNVVAEAAKANGKVYESPSPLPCDGTGKEAYYVQLGEAEEKKSGRKRGKGAGTAARLLALANLASKPHEGANSAPATPATTSSTPPSLEEDGSTSSASATATISASTSSASLPDHSDHVDRHQTSTSEASDFLSEDVLSKMAETELLYPLGDALANNEPVPRAFHNANAKTAAMAWLGASCTVLHEAALKRGAELACSEDTPRGMEQELGKIVVDKLQDGPALVAFDESTEPEVCATVEAEEWADEQNAKAWVRYAQTFAMSVHLAVQSALPTESLAATIPSFFRNVQKSGAEVPKAAQSHILSAVNALESGVSKHILKPSDGMLSEALSRVSTMPSGLHKSVKNALSEASSACMASLRRTGAAQVDKATSVEAKPAALKE